jgi:hypothetical protein
VVFRERLEPSKELAHHGGRAGDVAVAHVVERLLEHARQVVGRRAPQEEQVAFSAAAIAALDARERAEVKRHLGRLVLARRRDRRLVLHRRRGG